LKGHFSPDNGTAQRNQKNRLTWLKSGGGESTARALKNECTFCRRGKRKGVSILIPISRQDVGEAPALGVTIFSQQEEEKERFISQPTPAEQRPANKFSEK